MAACCKNSVTCYEKVHLPARRVDCQRIGPTFPAGARSQPELIPGIGSIWRTHRTGEQVSRAIRAGLTKPSSTVGPRSTSCWAWRRNNPRRAEPVAVKKELASIYCNMGKWLQLGGNLAEAEESYRKGMAILNQVEPRPPACRTLGNRWLLATPSWANCSERKSETKVLKPSSSRRSAVSSSGQLDYPRIPRYRKHLCAFMSC